MWRLCDWTVTGVDVRNRRDGLTVQRMRRKQTVKVLANGKDGASKLWIVMMTSPAQPVRTRRPLIYPARDDYMPPRAYSKDIETGNGKQANARDPWADQIRPCVFT